MPSLKDVKLQIVGVGKTKQITRAMEMVASASLRGAQMRIERFRPYAEKFGAMLGDLAARTEGGAHPLLEAHDEQKNVIIVLITSDRGLCGGFNANLIKEAVSLARRAQGDGKAVRFICVGRKSRDAARKQGFEILEAYPDVMGNFTFQLAARIGGTVSREYTEKTADEVYLVYSEFVSTSKQVPTSMTVLPVQPAAAEGAETEYAYEPSVKTLLAELLPRYVNVQLFRGLLATSAGENAARMLAMNNATKNCDDLIANLTLLYNKARQAAITNELIDIVGGANALQS